MAYQDHFRLADEYILHLDAVMNSIPDPFIKSRYVGFVAVSAVTAYELAIKEIFIAFAEKKHKALGSFSRAFFYRINGRIKRDELRKEYIKKFGDKYLEAFDKKLNIKEMEILQSQRVSIKEAYANIINWRNDFAHEGIIPTTPTYEEVKTSYELGKNVINCLAASMVR